MSFYQTFFQVGKLEGIVQKASHKLHLFLYTSIGIHRGQL